ncbi:hypothetical protein [Campylobacter sp.]|uniref:hypothetical protein n=1 Tax=Campylobacter sp. TaxID=205 RepID=UPI0025C65087|nr:hypothetical protein [Campylobacter sp.]
MIDDDFLKEKQNIREKMLKYSRAVKEGKAYEVYHHKLNESDRILKNRINHKKKPRFVDFDDEYEIKPKKQSSIYLKEDLINVKLEEKKPSSIKLFFLKNKNNKKNTIHFKKKEIEHTKENKLKFSKIIAQSNAYVVCKIQNFKEKQRQNKQENKQNQKNKNSYEIEEKAIQEQFLVKKQDYPQQEQSENYITEDKYELLDGIKTEENKNLSLKNLFYAGAILFFTLLVFLPQIYIRNQIYYISRDIADLRSQEWILDEENKELQRQLESIYFQNQVLDFLD